MKKSSAILYGRKYSTYVFDTVADTNKFLETHAGYGVLTSNEDGIHVAKMDDKGEEICE